MQILGSFLVLLLLVKELPLDYYCAPLDYHCAPLDCIVPHWITIAAIDFALLPLILHCCH